MHKSSKYSIRWPNEKRFAFTIFDDTDCSTLENTKEIYRFLADLGFRTTKSVWPLRASMALAYEGSTCEEADYLRWVKNLQHAGFEIGFHMAKSQTSIRSETDKGLQQFAENFGQYPKTMANHSKCQENIYWGNSRFTGKNSLIYNILTRYQHNNVYRGHIPGDPLFWGDFCREKIKYVRNFVFSDINSLKACPYMPYQDPDRPYVQYWFASSKGNNVATFNQCLNEESQDRLEEEGGACIMYVHFASHFYLDGQINPRFRFLMERLRKKNGWFVPTSTLLDHIENIRGIHSISPKERSWLERKWLWDQIKSRLNST